MNILDKLRVSFDWSEDKNNGYFFEDGSYRDRVIKHDTLHLLKLDDERKKPIKLRFEDEYEAGIIQAVLEGRASISRIPSNKLCNRDNVGEDRIDTFVIKEKTIPQVAKFLNDIFESLGRKKPESFRSDVSDEFINANIKIGRDFGAVFKQKHDINYVAMDIKDFVKIPFSELKSLFQKAEMTAKYRNFNINQETVERRL